MRGFHALAQSVICGKMWVQGGDGVKMRKVKRALLITFVVIFIICVAIYALIRVLCGSYYDLFKTEHSIKKYVRKNHDTIAVDADSNSSWFFVKDSYVYDVRIELGYYYSAVNKNLFYKSDEKMGGKGYPYGGGLVYSYRDCWYFTQPICDNWFYYEYHFGDMEWYENLIYDDDY